MHLFCVFYSLILFFSLFFFLRSICQTGAATQWQACEEEEDDRETEHLKPVLQ